MRYRIHQVKLNISESHQDFKKAIEKKLKKKNLDITDIEIVKESIDARKKPDVKLVYTLDFTCDAVLPLDEAKRSKYERPYSDCDITEFQNEKPPVVVGFGPCGMFAGLILAEAGMKPVIIERGQKVDDRIKAVEAFWNGEKLNVESNVQFGEGGAGTFSDGKLTTGIKDVRISKVLEEFVEAGAGKEIMYRNKPHIGTDKLVEIVKSIRKKIESLGGSVLFETKLEQLIIDEDATEKRLKGIKTNKGEIETDSLIVAIGHSARDTFRMLYDNGLDMEQKQFSIGVRIEHPQKLIDRVQYGDERHAKRLGAADYKLNHRCGNGRGVYTFCMCPGGFVINASSEEETAVTNGMSNSDRSGEYANSGLLVDVKTTDFESNHPLAGIEFQRKYEKLAFVNGKGTLPKTTFGQFRNESVNSVKDSLPEFAVEAILEAMPHLDRKLRGFASDGAIMTGVETRSSSPVRILRDDDYMSSVEGLYPSGEGPGYAGGIMSAAVDGIRTAEKVICRIFE